MSVATTYYLQAGIPLTLRPPLSGVYYSSIAVYNPLPYTFAVQNGVNQNTLAAGSAQLFSMPTSGSPLALVPPANDFTFSSYLGAIQAIWFEADETPGTYPFSLNPPAGSLVQWTPLIFIVEGGGVGDGTPWFVPSGALSSVTFTTTGSRTSGFPTLTVYGFPSNEEVGTVPGSDIVSGTSNTAPITPVAGDTQYYVAASGTLVAWDGMIGLGVAA